jgi:hypothetical protein
MDGGDRDEPDPFDDRAAFEIDIREEANVASL